MRVVGAAAKRGQRPPRAAAIDSSPRRRPLGVFECGSSALSSRRGLQPAPARLRAQQREPSAASTPSRSSTVRGVEQVRSDRVGALVRAGRPPPGQCRRQRPRRRAAARAVSASPNAAGSPELLAASRIAWLRVLELDAEPLGRLGDLAGDASAWRCACEPSVSACSAVNSSPAPRGRAGPRRTRAGHGARCRSAPPAAATRRRSAARPPRR